MIFTTVLIPEQVKLEVVDGGKQLGRADALSVEKAIQENWIKVYKTGLISTPIELESGETAVLSLARKLKIREVLIDEISARTVAKVLGLQPRGTLFVLLSALKRKAIGHEEFLDSIDLLMKHGFRLRQDVYLQAIREARKMMTRADT